MSTRPIYRMCAQVAPSGECLRGKGPPDRIIGKTWRRLFLAAHPLWAKPDWHVAVLRCRLLYIVCKVERLVLTTLNEDYHHYYLSVVCTDQCFHVNQSALVVICRRFNSMQRRRGDRITIRWQRPHHAIFAWSVKIHSSRNKKIT